MLNKYQKYYLQVDCNFTKKISLCEPDDMKSYTPFSHDICKDKYNVNLLGIDDELICCYLIGKNIQNQDVYSCIGIDNFLYTEKDRINELESGEFPRTGNLKDIIIECDNSLSSSFLSKSLFLLVGLFSLIL